MSAKRFVVGFVCGFGIFALIPVARGDLSDPTPLDMGLATSVDPTSFGILISAAVPHSSSIDFAHAPVESEAFVSELVFTTAVPLVHIDRESFSLFSSDAFLLTRLADAPQGFTGRSANRIRREPARDPGGLAWVLSGMLSVGVLQVGRGTRHLHFAAVPEWYHDGGQTQVGHPAPFDFDWSRMPLCRFEQLASATGPLFLRLLRGERSARRDSQSSLLSVAAPRGPPSES